MILVDTALVAREKANLPIRVAVIGAGFQGAAVIRQILQFVPGMTVVGVANRHCKKAADALSAAGCSSVYESGRGAISKAISRGDIVATDDAVGLAAADNIDAVFEVTGSFEYAAHAVMSAINARKHVVHMNAELDGTIGPVLKLYADRQNVIYSFSDGDQPGVQMNLIRFARGLGMKVRLAGNIKGLHDPSRNPDTQAAFAARWGQKPAMVASFADGTKISYEQAIVANACDFGVAQRGMLGPDFSKGNPAAPLVAIEDAAEFFAETLNNHERGIVDYVVGARPGPGVFVIGTHDDPRQRHFLDLYKMGKGPYYCFYTPYHLCHFEVPNSIARVVLFDDPVITPLAGPKVGVIAIAKKSLEPGEALVELGGFEVYGVTENQTVIDARSLLPLGLAIGSKMVKFVPQGQALVFDDVVRPSGRLIDKLYDEQRDRFKSDGKGHFPE